MDIPSAERAGKALFWRRRKLWFTCLSLCVTVVAASMYWSNRDVQPQFVGSESCATCHKDLSEAYFHTAHAQTSSWPSATTVLGDFTPGRNVMQTGNPNLRFQMDADGREFTQSAISRGSVGDQAVRKETIDVVIGSGRKGQTYLHWEDDALCQLPVTYWTHAKRWVNSPGFKDGEAKFDRPIPSRCLECHATTVHPIPKSINRYDRASLVLGLSCEKCHGPGSEHVRRYQSASPPLSFEDSAILNPARLPLDRQMDLCALCHAGEGRAITPPLSYRPGDVLSKHVNFPRHREGGAIDVHASQVQLLQSSQCFQRSGKMSCSTCHNVHQPQRDLVKMSATCLQCHQVEDCGKFLTRGGAIAQDCVGCHMPLEQTRQIVISDLAEGVLQPKVRNHRIGIYPEPAAP